MALSDSNPQTFQERICRRFEVPSERYGAIVLQLTLYPHACRLLAFSTSEFLGPDRAFIVAVGRLTRWRGFDDEVREFRHDPRNRLFTRRVLRLRVSVGRMRVLFSQMWDEPTAGASQSRDKATMGYGPLQIGCSVPSASPGWPPVRAL